jgi:hypothetical protein
MRPERNAPKNGEPTVGFSFTTKFLHTGRFWLCIFLAKNILTTLENSLYSPDLVAVDFYLFSRLKSELTGLHFCDAKNIIKNATEDLKRVSHWLPEVCSCIRGLF